MFKENFDIRFINLNRVSERKEVADFLKEHELLLEKDVDYIVGIYDNDSLIATGSLSGNVLKCIAIDPKYQGEGISNKIISHLINEEYQRGNTHLFIFTKPENKELFEDIGFKEITRIDEKVSLLENDPNGIKRYIEKVGAKRREGSIISSIVMNCNPFTLGHQYLIEKASSISDVLHIFLVWENRSLFPNEVRLKLLEEGTRHLDNIIIHKGENYIISNSTFPSYFIKEKNSVVKTHAMLDIKIFGEYIAPALGINRRIVGAEPKDPVTNEYNETMKELLPNYNIEVLEIPRLEEGKEVISASKVRKAIREDNVESLKKLVPMTTYRFIQSDEARNIIERIKEHK